MSKLSFIGRQWTVFDAANKTHRMYFKEFQRRSTWGSCLVRFICELESQIKDHSEGFRFVGTDNYKYEWITEAVPYDQFYDWVDLTLTASVDGVTKVDPTIL